MAATAITSCSTSRLAGLCAQQVHERLTARFELERFGWLAVVLVDNEVWL